MPTREEAAIVAETKPRSVFLTDKQVGDRYSVTRITIWRWARTDPAFPQPISLSKGCVRWRLAELEAWEDARAAAVA